MQDVVTAAMVWLPLFELTGTDPFMDAEELKDELDDELRVVHDEQENEVLIERRVEDGGGWSEYAKENWPDPDGEYGEIISNTGGMVEQRTDLRSVFVFCDDEHRIEEWSDGE